jgi:tyrosyl-tRNA synthetase
MKKDAIAKRLESEEGITYTEFAYPLLQAYDFLHLFKTKNCEVQVSGSDQWGNIMAGVDLIRRKEGKIAYALTTPLVTDKATGKKFGKSEGNAIWLDPSKTSPYQFYQFWYNVSDSSVGEYLKLFTLVSLKDIDLILKEHKDSPSLRTAQKKLAYEVTALVHGKEEADKAITQAQALFNGDVSYVSIDTPATKVTVGMTIVDALILSRLATSKREARQFLVDGAIVLNNERVTDRALEERDFKDSKALLKRGKRNVAVLTIG